MIWSNPLTVAAANDVHEGTLVAHLGIEVIEIGDDFVVARMPVDRRTLQVHGMLHGGASLALAETLGSFAANCCVDAATEYCVGLEINANHIRAVRSGMVTGTARSLHRGRSTQVWRITTVDEAARLVCESRLTVAVMTRDPESA